MENAVSILSDLLADEYVSWFAYQRIRGFLVGPFGDNLDRLLGEVSQDEISHHAVVLQERISELTSIMPFSCIAQAIDEATAVSGYATSSTLAASAMGYVLEAQACVAVGSAMVALQDDSTTVAILKEILEDEKYHAERFLSIFKSITDQTGSDEIINLGTLAIFVVKKQDCHKIIGYALKKCDTWSPVSFASEWEKEVICATERLNTEECCVDAPCLEAGYVSGNLIQPQYSEPVCTIAVPQSYVTDSVSGKLKEFRVRIKDAMENRNINGKDVKVAKFANADEANKFLEKNKGFTPVDTDDTGAVYVALESEDDSNK